MMLSFAHFANTRRPMLWLIALFALAFSVTVLAAPYKVLVTTTQNGFTLSADSPIRFNLDYTARTLILPDASLAESSGVPASVSFETRQDGLVLHFTYDFTVSLSPNGRTVTVIRVENAVSQEQTDARIPVFYRLSNANPSQVAAMLTRLYPNLRVEVDERQRALVILVNPTDKPVIDAVIKELDVPRPQVMFEAEILEINRSVTQQLGIDYTKLINLNLKVVEGTPNGLGFGSFSRGPLSLEVGIKLLKDTGAARTLARPRAVTLDGLEARLNATTTQPIRTVSQSGTISVANITTGINLRFVPKVAPDNTIESQLSIAVSSPTGSTSDGLPSYSTREANTTVRVRNGEPIVIGGLLESRESTGATGIPGLMDIPILGELFKSTFTEQRETDLLITITPYLVLPANSPILPSTPVGPPVPGDGSEPR
jgi:type II secretory pathway component GspD/PulD (secretin)